MLKTDIMQRNHVTIKMRGDKLSLVTSVRGMENDDD